MPSYTTSVGNVGLLSLNDGMPVRIESDLSRHTRHSVMDMLENERVLVSAGHLPHPDFGHFVRVEGRRSWRGHLTASACQLHVKRKEVQLW
jgi:hypothetical protein